MARARAGQNGTNSLASSQSSTNRNGSASGQSQRGKNGQQLASNEQSGQNGQSDQNSSGQQQGQQGQQGKQGSGGMGSGSQTQQASNDAQNQEGQQGQNGQGQNGSQAQGQAQAKGQGQGQGQGQLAQNQGGQQPDGSPRQGNPQQQGQNGRAGGARNAGGRQNFFDTWGNKVGGYNGGGGDGNHGPLTGDDYVAWSDRLRDIEETLQDPQLRNEVTRIRDRAREMRTEFKRHAALPQWNIVDSDIVTPMHILQSRVAEQLARIQSKEAVVPLDRDPVPTKYSDLVSRYYEKLGKD